MTTLTIGTWGNALAVRIPRQFCKQLNWDAGDTVSLSVDGDNLVLQNSNEAYTLKGRMSAWSEDRFITQEYDWGNPAGDEVW